jgi:hypothetical protein
MVGDEILAGARVHGRQRPDTTLGWLASQQDEGMPGLTLGDAGFDELESGQEADDVFSGCGGTDDRLDIPQ